MVTICGPVGSPSPIFMVALKVPTEGGVKVKLNVQLELAGTLGWQLLIWPKAFWPVKFTLLIGIATDPAFWKVTGIEALVVPTFVVGKVTEVGETFTAVACPLINNPCFISVKFP